MATYRVKKESKGRVVNEKFGSILLNDETSQEDLAKLVKANDHYLQFIEEIESVDKASAAGKSAKSDK